MKKYTVHQIGYYSTDIEKESEYPNEKVFIKSICKKKTDYYVLCIMYYVLCIMYYVLCIVYYLKN